MPIEPDGLHWGATHTIRTTVAANYFDSTLVRTMRVNSDEVIFDKSLIVLYQDEPFTGEAVDVDHNGNIVGLTTYVGGVAHGPEYELFPNGNKKTEGVCDHGVAVREWREWHANGRLVELNIFNEYGERVRRQRWEENGNLIMDKTLRPRKLPGESKNES